MVAANFSKALDQVLKYEGGKVDHPKDPGGATNQGVTQAVYRAFRKNKGVHVFNMTDAERDAIYKQQYWDAAQCDRLPSGLDLAVFDFAVNSGVSRALRMLRSVLSLPVGEFTVGAITLNAIQQNNVPNIIEAYCARRMAFLKNLTTFKTFGKGWTRRVEHVRKTALAWAADETYRFDTPVGNGVDARADVKDVQPLQNPTVADTATSAGTTTVILTQAIDALTPLSSLNPKIATTILVLTIGGVLIAIAGVLWRRYIAKRNKEIMFAAGEI